MDTKAPGAPRVRVKVKPREISDDELLAELTSVASQLGKTSLSKAEFNRHSQKGCASSVIRRFMGWSNALRRAGLEYGGPAVTDRMRLQPGQARGRDEIIKELKRVAEITGKYPSQEAFAMHAEFSTARVRSEFSSWRAATLAAGFPPPREASRFSEAECFENLLHVWTALGRQPTFSDMKCTASKIGPKAYERKFGGWNAALVAFQSFISEEQDSPASVPYEAARAKRPSKRDSAPSRAISLRLRYTVLTRDRFRCVLCGASPTVVEGCRLHIDHVVPLSKGGATSIENLRCLCESCNLGKGDLQIEGD